MGPGVFNTLLTPADLPGKDLADMAFEAGRSASLDCDAWASWALTPSIYAQCPFRQ